MEQVSQPAWTGSPCTLVEVLGERGRAQRDQVAFVFLKDGEQEAGSLTFGELDERARSLGAALRRRGATGQRILLLYPQGLDFIIAFFGTLHAGAVAVPAPVEQNGRGTRLAAIIDEAAPVAALTSPSLVEETRAALAGKLPVYCIEALEQELSAAAPAAPDRPLPIDGLALLQFTSGSTQAPKGVMITHANIMHNQELIRRCFEHSHRMVVVSWLPMFHDMGLIGNILQPVYVGGKCLLMSPAAFLQNPIRWPRAISRYRGTTAGGPNFGYDFCAERTTAEDRRGLDLTSWDLAYSGSEPVRASTLDRFVAAFEPCGFQRNAFYPCYGMAEATLLVSGGTKAAEPVVRNIATEPGEDEGDNATAVKRIVSCGATGLGQKLAIVDPATRRLLPDGSVGEIWLAGPSVSPGYWKRPDETAAAFGHRLADRACSTDFMRTGDLGMMEAGELYVTGRLKELIIVRGRNHYPQDIEETAQTSHAALRRGCGAAFMLEDSDRQRLVVVNEVARSHLRDLRAAEIAGSIRAAVSKQHGLQVAGVVLLKTGAIPKTSSGKIQRGLCKGKFVSGALSIVAEDWFGAGPRAGTRPPSEPIRHVSLADVRHQDRGAENRGRAHE